jgi:hypothetical protein
MNSIEPIGVWRSVVGFDVKLLRLNMFVDATFIVDSYDNTDKIVKTDYITLTTEEYQQWNSDDSYIVNLVAEKLGYVIKPS